MREGEGNDTTDAVAPDEPPTQSDPTPPEVDPGEIDTTPRYRTREAEDVETRIVDPGEIGTVPVTKRDQSADVDEAKKSVD